MHVFKHLRRQQAKLDKDPTKQVTAHLSFEESHLTGKLVRGLLPTQVQRLPPHCCFAMAEPCAFACVFVYSHCRAPAPPSASRPWRKPSPPARPS